MARWPDGPACLAQDLGCYKKSRIEFFIDVNEGPMRQQSMQVRRRKRHRYAPSADPRLSTLGKRGRFGVTPSEWREGQPSFS
jgi:hypothetical protein